MSSYGENGFHVSDEWLEWPLIGHADCLHASPGHMQTQLSPLVADPRITTLSGEGSRHDGCFSSLAADNVHVGYLSFGEPITLQLWNQECFNCVAPLRGRARLEQYPEAPQGPNGPFFLHPKSDQQWQLSADCELLFLSVSVEPQTCSRISELLSQSSDFHGRNEFGQRMMETLPDRLHHGLLYREKLNRLQQIRKEFLQLFDASPERASPTLDIDPRVQRAMGYIRHLPARQYDLDSICSIAHMSRRTLYYAFKRNLESTPYAYFKACQLIRIRLALLQDLQARFSIAHHAAAHGVQHMGRFAAHYQAHFGERPSETREQIVTASPS